MGIQALCVQAGRVQNMFQPTHGISVKPTSSLMCCLEGGGRDMILCTSNACEKGSHVPERSLSAQTEFMLMFETGHGAGSVCAWNDSGMPQPMFWCREHNREHTLR